MSDKHYILRPTVANQSTFDCGDLNDDQRRAVMHQHGPILVVAGAGSGKTKTLCYRVARLIHDGVDPKRILLLTFTRKASQEMLRRAASLLDARCQKVMGGTFHSFCNMTLHRHASHRHPCRDRASHRHASQMHHRPCPLPSRPHGSRRGLRYHSTQIPPPANHHQRK